MSVFAAANVSGSADFSISIAGDETAGMSTSDVSVTTSPDGGVPDAAPVLVIPPLSTSACVVVYVAVQVKVSPGASDVPGQLTSDNPGSSSFTATGSSVTLPEFSTTYVK